MITEAEAGEKWCPMARAPADDNGFAINRALRSGEPDVDCMCIGSRCMAWRSQVVSLAHTDRDGEHPEAIMGWCGAFGRPE